MDVERSLCSCLLFLIILIYSGAVDDGLTSEATVVDTNQQCKVKLHGCKVNNDLSQITDPKGKQGEAGPKGEKGEKGDTGDKGPQGNKGPIGAPGIIGIEGSTGRAGLNGRCVDVDFFDSPVDSCESVLSTGEYTIGSANPIKVFCDLVRNFTCLNINGTTFEPKKYQHKDRPFWISEIDFDISEFYRGATMESIQELSRQSPLGIQSIRYHCKNSFVRPKNSNGTDDKALHLLNWKEDILGPSRNERSPFFYEIPNDTDGCKDSGDLNKEDWKSTDIILKSTTSQLPIIDFHIRDIRNENQQFYIELTELCFKF